MKTRYILLILPAVFVPLALVAQGPLTPPGAPAPVMKTLQQVEPRTDVATLTGDATAVIVIDKPGSYYLSANVPGRAAFSGIAIQAADVTLDLNGFAVTGVAGALRGVELRTGASGVVVKNGLISGFPAGPGVGVTGAGLANVRVEALSIRNCQGGVLIPNLVGATAEHIRVTGGNGSGIDLGTVGLVSDSVVESIAPSSATPQAGIRAAVVKGCHVNSVTNAGGQATGISGQEVKDCVVALVNGTAANTAGVEAPIVSHCRVSNITLTGTGNVLGIAAGDSTQTAGGHVTACHVFGVGNTGGSPTGIACATVSHCNVSNVGNSSSTGSIFGIVSATVTGSNVANCGTTSSPNTFGIVTKLASDCRVIGIASGAAVAGIAAMDTATNCSVQQLSQGNTQMGMSAFTGGSVFNCKAYIIEGNNSLSGTVGFGAYRVASNCHAELISNAGTAQSTGFSTTAGGQTINCTVTTAGDFGIRGNTGSLIKACTVRMNDTGTGISVEVSAEAVRIEGNTVSACTTGIAALGPRGLVIGNQVDDCVTNFSNNATCKTGPIISAGGFIASTNPWANFTD